MSENQNAKKLTQRVMRDHTSMNVKTTKAKKFLREFRRVTLRHAWNALC